MIYPEPAKLRRKGSGSVVSTEQGFSAERLSRARTVLASAPDLARGVLAGSEPLDRAYETVRHREGQARHSHVPDEPQDRKFPASRDFWHRAHVSATPAMLGSAFFPLGVPRGAGPPERRACRSLVFCAVAGKHRGTGRCLSAPQHSPEGTPSCFRARVPDVQHR